MAKLRSDKESKSRHSRAARRETSPSLDVDKSLQVLKTSEPTEIKPHVLAARHGASVQKSKSKPLTRAQRLRREKGLERAEMVMDQLDKKVSKSVGKVKVIKDRRATWDDINSTSKKHGKNRQVSRAEVEHVDEDGDVTLSGAPVAESTAKSQIPTENRPENISEEDDGIL